MRAEHFLNRLSCLVKTRLPKRNENPMKRNNLICVKRILWYIRFAVTSAFCRLSECTMHRLSFSAVSADKSDVTWRIVPKVGLVLMFFGGIRRCSLPEPERRRVHSH